MRRMILLLILALTACAAIEEGGATVTYVTDGDTIAVRRADGSEAKIRLLCIDTPESKDNSHGEASAAGKAASQALKQLAPVGTTVRLWGPGATLEADRYGRLLAVVLIGASGRDSLNERQIAAGWTPYWRKYGELADPELHKRFLAAQFAAETAGAGAWTTDPVYMRDKVNERTAPRR